MTSKQKMKFSEKLKEQRGGLTQREAADAIGTPVATYRNWEGGLFEPSPSRQKTALAHLAETAGGEEVV